MALTLIDGNNRLRALFEKAGTSPRPRPTTRQDDTGSGGWTGAWVGTGFLQRTLSPLQKTRIHPI